MNVTLKTQIRSLVRKRMVTFDSSGCGQSRRIPGMFNRDEELTGFENLCIYIDSCLAGAMETISEILEQIDGCIYEQDHYNHTRWLMFFGCNTDKLVATPPSSVHQTIKKSIWHGIIAKMITNNPSIGNSFLPKLHNSDGQNTHPPGANDLAVFFTNRRNVHITRGMHNKFIFLRKKALWFFVNDDLSFDLETRGFVPETNDVCQSINR